jgi:hypothetical protein
VDNPRLEYVKNRLDSCGGDDGTVQGVLHTPEWPLLPPRRRESGCPTTTRRTSSTTVDQFDLSDVYERHAFDFPFAYASSRETDGRTGEGGRAVGYIRVSTRGQGQEGVSLAAQEARIRALCTAKGWGLLRVYRDQGVSGKSLAQSSRGQGVID